MMLALLLVFRKRIMGGTGLSQTMASLFIRGAPRIATCFSKDTFVGKRMLEGDTTMSENTQPVLPGMQRTEPKEPGVTERDLGMERVAVSAGEAWMDHAYQVVRYVAQTHNEFTADHLHHAGAHLGLPQPPDPRAWGPVMMKARKVGIIVKTGKYKPSRRPTCHRRPIPVYLSMIHRGPYREREVMP